MCLYKINTSFVFWACGFLRKDKLKMLVHTNIFTHEHTHHPVFLLWSLCASVLAVSTPNPSVCEVCKPHMLPTRHQTSPLSPEPCPHYLCLSLLHVGSLPSGSEHKFCLLRSMWRFNWEKGVFCILNGSLRLGNFLLNLQDI